MDSNFLLVPIIYRIDLKDELSKILCSDFDILILSCEIDELKKKYESLKEGLQKRRIKFALDYAKNFKIVDFPKVEGEVDKAIVEYAKNFKCMVATNDRYLRKTLRRLGIPTIFVREGRKLDVEGYS
ncbi:MAG: type II toxin-antitoxin system VapC family toxin [Candidatus Asgardarchaeia archaeon]